MAEKEVPRDQDPGDTAHNHGLDQKAATTEAISIGAAGDGVGLAHRQAVSVYSTDAAFEPTESGNPHGYTKSRAFGVLNRNGDLGCRGACHEETGGAVILGPSDIDTMQIDGAELLDRVSARLTKHVAFANEHQSVAATLWTAATHGLECWHHATRLAITSPQKRCAKSRLLDIIAGMSHSPMMCADSSTAAIYRSLGYADDQGAAKTPTLFVDEADALFGTKRAAEQNEDLRALFNAGFQRNRPVWRCVGGAKIPTAFNSFAMAALAAIKGLPDTITDRAVHIVLQRRRPTDRVSPFRVRRDGPALERLRTELAAWVREESRLKQLGEVEPEMPVEDRAADAWEPLIAIADAAGGHWPRLAREACKALSAEAEEAEVDQADILLIRDIEQVFTTTDAPFLRSQDLVDALREIKDSPWDDWELTPSKLANRLKPYGVRPAHDSSGDHRGYKLQCFYDLFARYGRQNQSSHQMQGYDQGEHGEKADDDELSEGCQNRQSKQTQTSSDSLADSNGSANDARHSGRSDTLTASDGTPDTNRTTAFEEESPARPTGTAEDFDRLRRKLCMLTSQQTPNGTVQDTGLHATWHEEDR